MSSCDSGDDDGSDDDDDDDAATAAVATYDVEAMRRTMRFQY